MRRSLPIQTRGISDAGRPVVAPRFRPSLRLAGIMDTSNRHLGVGAAGALMFGVIALWIAGLPDFAFVAGAALLGGLCAWVLSHAIHNGRFALDHPSAIMTFVILLYWLIGGLEARNSPQVLLSAGAVDWLGPSLLQGALFLAAFVAVAGVPAPAVRGLRAQEPRAPSRNGWLGLGGAYAILWSLRMFEVEQGTYFSHGGLTLDASDPGIGFIMQLAGGLLFIPGLLSAVLYVRGRDRTATAIALLEILFLFGAGERLLLLSFLLSLGFFLSVLGRPPKTSSLLKVLFLVLVVAHPLIIGMREVVGERGGAMGTSGPIAIFTEVLPATIGSLAHLSSSNEGGVAALAQRSSASGYLAAVMDHADQSGGHFFEGETYFRTAETLIPHFLWPDKPQLPYDPLDAISWRFGLERIDYIFTPLTEAYCNFGTAGTLVYGVLMGLFGRWLQGQNTKHQNDPVVLLALSPLLAILISFETHSTIGSLSSARLAAGMLLAIALYRRVKHPSQNHAVDHHA